MRHFANLSVCGCGLDVSAHFCEMATLETVPGILNFVNSSIVMERKSHKEVSDELTL